MSEDSLLSQDALRGERWAGPGPGPRPARTPLRSYWVPVSASEIVLGTTDLHSYWVCGSMRGIVPGMLIKGFTVLWARNHNFYIIIIIVIIIIILLLLYGPGP